MNGDRVNSALLELIGSAQKIQVFPGVVKSVDRTINTCEVVPIDEGATFYNVRLRAAIVENPKSTLLIIPKVNSTVLVGIIANDDRQCFICDYSEIEEVIVEGVQKVSINSASLFLNGDKYASLKGQETIDEIKKLNAQVQALILVLSGAPIPEPGNGSPSALQAALSTALSNKSAGVFENLTNSKVKHGDD